MARLRCILRLAERHAVQHDGRIRAEHGVIGVLLGDLARLHERVADHGIARALPILYLIHGGRDRDERCPDLPQECTPSGRCRRKNKHILSPNQKGLLHESKRATAPSHISL